MVDGSKVGSMIVMVIIGIIIIILGGLVIWKYRQDQAILASLQASGSLTSANMAQLPKSGWVYGLAALQILLGVILVIWGVAQYFIGSKQIEMVKEYASRALHHASSPAAPVAATTAIVEPVTSAIPPVEGGGAKTVTSYSPMATPHTGGSRRAVRV
jgi:hypothetical protein